MIGSFITRGLVMLLGYAYPAYECYKTVEKNKPDVEQLRFWCQYWILVAVLTVFERVGDTFVSWVPMYSEAKLFFFIYLWYPKTKGTAYVYDSFFRPYISQHETNIDRNLLELRTRAEDYAVLYWQKAASYGQTRVFDILQYIASQSTPTPPHSTQSRPTRVRQPPAAQNRQAAVTVQTPIDEPASPASRTSSSEAQKDSVEEKDPADIPESPPPADAMNAQRSTVTQSLAGSSNPMASNVEALANEGGSLPKEDANPPVQDTVMEESIRVTRARLRQTRATSSR